MLRARPRLRVCWKGGLVAERHRTPTPPRNAPRAPPRAVDCKGVCNEPASKYVFRMKMPSLADALAGKWPKWEYSGGKPYEEMPWP